MLSTVLTRSQQRFLSWLFRTLGLSMPIAQRPAFKPSLFESLEPRQLYSIAPLSAAFQVSDLATAAFSPQIATSSTTGNFVVAWANGSGSFPDGDIHFILYDSDGNALTSDTLVNAEENLLVSTTLGTELPVAVTPKPITQKLFDVAMDAAGDFVVAWQGAADIYAQRFSATGDANGEMVVVSAEGSNSSPNAPSVAMDAAGDFTVAWLSSQDVAVNIKTMFPKSTYQYLGDNGKVKTGVSPGYAYVQATYYTASGVFARRFSADATPGAIIQVTADPPAPVEDVASKNFTTALNPVVAMDTAGNFAVAFDSVTHAPAKIQSYPATSSSYQQDDGYGHTVTLHYTTAATFTYNMSNTTRTVQVLAKRFNASNTQILTTISGAAKSGAIVGAELAIAMDGAGDFAVVSNLQYDPLVKTKTIPATDESDAYTYHYYATSNMVTLQRFTVATHAFSSAATVVKTTPAPMTSSPSGVSESQIRGISVAMDANSAATLVSWDKWTPYNGSSHSGYGGSYYSQVNEGVFAVRYSAAGVALDTPTAPIIAPDGDTKSLAEAVFAGGNFEFVYQQDLEGDTSIFAQAYRQPLADLTLGFGVGTLPPAFLASGGASGTVPIVVTNNGELTAKGSVALSAAFSTDNVFGNGDDQAATTKTFSISLAPGKSTTLTLTMALPAGLTPGSGFLVAHVAPNGASPMVESQATNNDASTAVVIASSNLQNLGVTSVVPKLPGTVLVPGDKTTVSVQVRNYGTQTLPANTPVVVEVFASTNGLIDSDAVSIGSLSTKQSLKAGAVANITVPVTITDALIEESYFFVARETAASLTETSALDNSFASTMATDVVWQFGQVAGRTGLTKFVETPVAGQTVTYALTGVGTGTFTDSGDGTKDLVLTNTTTSTAVTVTVAGGSLVRTLNSVSDDNPIKSFVASGIDLGTDASFSAGITTLSLHDVAGTHNIFIGGTGTGTGTTLTFHRVADLQLESDAPIAALTAVDWTSTDSSLNSIDAPVLNKLTISGDKAHSIAGEFAPAITLSGSSSASVKQTLGAVNIAGQITGGDWTVVKGTIASITAAGAASSWNLAAPASAVGAMNFGATVAGDIDVLSTTGLTVKGDLTGTTIQVQGTGSTLTALTVTGQMLNTEVRSNGSIGAVTLGAMRNSLLFAGVDDGETTLPTNVTAFTATRKISSVTIKGITGDGTAQFVNSNIAATNLGAIKLGKVDTLNVVNSAAAFGVAFRGPAATTGLASLSYTRFSDSVAVSIVVKNLLPGANIDTARTIEVLV